MPVVELSLLRSLPLFAPLGPPQLESLVRELESVEVPAGEDVVHEGEPGDRFYAIADGELEGRTTVATSRRCVAATASARSPSCVTCPGR